MENNLAPNKDPLEKIQQIKSFIPTTFIYFAFTLWASKEGHTFPLWGALIVKVLPILVLIRFVLRQHKSNLGATWRCTFSRLVFLGLCFSLAGDALLVFQQISDIYFIAGLISFGISHTLYICAFGWTPFAPRLLLGVAVIAVGYYWFLWQGGLNALSLPLKIGVAVYSGLNGGMNWRSWARLSFQDFRDGRWYEFFGCIGAVNFLVSDAILAANKFVSPIPYSDYLIMGTYYTAQLGIALSVVDGPDKYGDIKKSKDT